MRFALLLAALLCFPGAAPGADDFMGLAWFHAAWCSACRSMEPAVDSLVREGKPIRTVDMDRTPGATRITIANDNVAGVLGHVLGVLADAQVNVLDMSNRSRDALAYNIIDVESAPDGKVIETIRDVGNVIRVRVV